MRDHPNYAQAVENLQRYLRQLAYWEENLPMPPADGIFESRTEESLRAYQTSRGLPVTGNADQETWERLYAEYRASLAQHSPPRQVSVFYLEPEGDRITDGSVGFAVTALQYMLSELRRSYTALEGVEITGVYDEKTAEAVRAFQKANRLSDGDGVGLMTWNAITDQYNTVFSAGTDE